MPVQDVCGGQVPRWHHQAADQGLRCCHAAVASAGPGRCGLGSGHTGQPAAFLPAGQLPCGLCFLSTSSIDPGEFHPFISRFFFFPILSPFMLFPSSFPALSILFSALASYAAEVLGNKIIRPDKVWVRVILESRDHTHGLASFLVACWCFG